MTAQAMLLVEYPAMKERAMHVMAKMKINLEKYAEKPDANPDYVKDREKDLAILVELINITEKTVQLVNQEAIQRYKDGFEKGKKISNRFSVEDTTREQRRTSHNLAQYQKWSDHY